MNTPRTGVIARLAAPPPAALESESNWDHPAWQHAPELVIDQHMGVKPAHFPRASARLGWDPDALYVSFRVEDAYVRAVARNHHDSVCADSCVEWFFSPGLDVAVGYFNLEINCGGTVLFNYQKQPRKACVPISETHLAQLSISRSLPQIVEPEIQEPVTWFVECRLPFAILESYCAFPRPKPGDAWRANLYKCADKTSHPHWLTWSPIMLPRPDFHVPGQFGTLTFG